jgi:salicylate hydroxylase
MERLRSLTGTVDFIQRRGRANHRRRKNSALAKTTNDRRADDDDDADESFRVLVLGAGPAGLTSALSLQRNLSKLVPVGKLEISVVDRNENALRRTIGGGFNINGGAAVLEKLGVYDECFRELRNSLEKVRARRCDENRTELFEVDVGEEVRKDSFFGVKKTLVNETNGEVMAGTVMRADLSKKLSEAFLNCNGNGDDDDGDQFSLTLGCEIVNIDAETGEVQFVNSKNNKMNGNATNIGALETRKFDLIIGADGIDSLARKTIINSIDSKNNRSDDSFRNSRSKRKEPVYSGIKILFGVTGVDNNVDALMREKTDQTTAHQWFSDGSYALIFTGGGVNQKRHNLAFCSNEPLGSANSNPSWRADTSVTKEYAHSKMMQANMPSDVLNLCLRCERFFEIGVFFHEPMEEWFSGKLVLVGDSAHAMPPFLGQGANQAMQDAFVLSKVLQKCTNLKDANLLNESLMEYSKLRRPPTEAIMNASRFVGALETGKGIVGLFRDFAFTIAGKFGITGKIFLSGATPRIF